MDKFWNVSVIAAFVLGAAFALGLTALDRYPEGPQLRTYLLAHPEIVAGIGTFSPTNAQIRDYLLAHPGIIAETGARLASVRQAAENRVNAAATKKIGLEPFFDPNIAFITGPANAKKTLVEFYDYECPYCRASVPVIKEYYEAHKNDTRFAFIEFPIPSLHGPSATLAARLSLAARYQPEKFMALHFALMSLPEAADEQTIYEAAKNAGFNVNELKTRMQMPKIDKTITASHTLATRAGIIGTPTFIVNGVIRPGAVDEYVFASYFKS